jgi:hypothetical protein
LVGFVHQHADGGGAGDVHGFSRVATKECLEKVIKRGDIAVKSGFYRRISLTGKWGMAPRCGR